MNDAKILIADDGKVMRMVISKKLESEGYQVVAVPGGQEALDAISQGSIDLLILDISMPDLDGMEALQILRKTHSETQLPVIMATANDEDEDIVRAFEHGANDFVTKPINFPVLSARIRTQLRLKRAIEELERLAADRLDEEPSS